MDDANALQVSLDILNALKADTVLDLFARHSVVLAYVYGSQARDQAGPLSDVDVAVLFAPGLSKQVRFRHVLVLTNELGAALRRDDVQVVDLQDASPLLRHRVYYDGHVLYCPDDAVRVKFETTALRDYVDTAPLRRLKERYLCQRFGGKRPMMADKESLLARLEALDTYLAELDHYAQYRVEEMASDFVKYRAVQHSLQLAAQAIVGIASHIVTADYHSRAQEYREVIAELGSVGVLEPEFAQRLAPLAGFRNIPVHDYLQVDPAIVHDILVNGRADLREFGKRITVYFQEQ